MTAYLARRTGNDDWYTPAKYLDAAREVMGAIDLDPASCAEANATVRAERFYSLEDDGLFQPWSGRIWLNPPYSRGRIDKFAERLMVMRPHFDQAIVLVNNATATRWFQRLLNLADGLCLPQRRIQFLGSSSGPDANRNLQGQAFLYYGLYAEQFCCVFRRFGWVDVIDTADHTWSMLKRMAGESNADPLP